jgi:hypothetical protein
MAKVGDHTERIVSIGIVVRLNESIGTGRLNESIGAG